MAWAKLKTEHGGGSRGRGWVPHQIAKQAAKRRRRRADKRAIADGRA
jgi:hypothetical protein